MNRPVTMISIPANGTPRDCFAQWRDGTFLGQMPEAQARALECAFFAGVMSVAAILRVQGGLDLPEEPGRLRETMEMITQDIRAHLQRMAH